MALIDFSAVKNVRNMSRQEIVGSLQSNSRRILSGNLGVPVMLLVLLGLMTLPVPPFLLDIFFTFNIALAIVVLLVSIYVLRPLDFAVFPTILLISTLLRLSLNVASTRVVLMYGHEGGDSAGKVIQAFGEVLIGGNYAVGLVVFAILMIINFVVVTKGAGRVSEVSARFTLDAMPGKQMAIDADLNAGLIDAETAKTRRLEVGQEADFYGSMDGASKFVRGDAVAGVLILLINIVGGLAIGTLQYSLEFGDAVEKYALLTIGDGLVAQIPSLLLSTAAAIMVTRNSSSEQMGDQVVNQMFGSPKALMISAVLLAILGSIPGMPHLVFLGLALVAGFGAWFIYRKQAAPADGSGKALAPPKGGGAGAGKAAPVSKDGGGPGAAAVPALENENKELSWDDVQQIDMVGLEVGYRIIPIVDRSQGGQLLNRIKGVRKKLSQDVGFLMPSIHIRDNLDLMPNTYRITLMGVTIAEDQVYPDREMAINPGQVFGAIDGLAAKDPAFGLDAVWIEPGKREKAQSLGYTVVDSSTVIATHLNQILSKHSHELLGHEEVQKLVDRLAEASPRLSEELVPNTVSISLLLRVLQNLLIEQVPIRDMRSIAEALTNLQPKSQDPNVLTAVARTALSRLIVQNIVGNAPDLPVITLDRDLEQLLLRTIQQAGQDGSLDTIMLEPSLAEKLQGSLARAVQEQEMKGNPAVLLVGGAIRMMMARFLRHSIPSITVLAYQEIPDNKQITIVATVGK
ncbi:flagellar biosynthesis pathway, component FlhA [Gynuella sunshinyii YC6258]|uniref:Flagellar biosynthesis protein FlhA n=2 Tax=Gynuella sunshinyii TaxID=1445505 RepID=A0A0C5VZW3_9GAMM|nr:flagellar biosynthesis pathway, component FlhA [Gynuella sunshinyii YC6258]